jgi:sigma-B regulation protein RsbU (phosphoserine phosphatase)
VVFTAAKLVHGAFRRRDRPGDYLVWGVVVLDMDWNKLLNFFQHLPSAEVVILDQDARLTAAPDRDKLLTRSPAQLKLARSLIRTPKQAPSQPFAWDGRSFLGEARGLTLAPGLDWTVMVRADMTVIMRPAHQVRLVIVGVTLACLLLAAGGIFLVSGVITRPIGALARAAHRVARGELDARVEIPRTREAAMLARSFNSMSEDLSRYIEELRRTTAEKERLASEMAIAAQLQKSVLPRRAPHAPGWDIAGAALPARETGGDFYDFIPLPNGRLGLVLADVSGKGLPAALFMLSCRAYLRTLALSGLGPVEVMAGANRQVAADSGDSGMFVTAFYAELDLQSGRLRYVNAGHNPPLALRGGAEGEMEELTRTGLPLGVLEDSEYGAREIALHAGDMLTMYTDGVTEAPDSQDREWGLERLRQEVRRGRRLRAGELLKRVRGLVQEWSGDLPQFDDMTLVAVYRLQDAPDGVGGYA